MANLEAKIEVEIGMSDEALWHEVFMGRVRDGRSVGKSAEHASSAVRLRREAKKAGWGHLGPGGAAQTPNHAHEVGSCAACDGGM